VNRIEAYIEDRYMARGVRLHLYRPSAIGQVSILMRDGTWAEHNEMHVLPEDAGVELPREAIAAIHEAIKRYGGTLTDEGTEVKVLREWLEVERGRVDRLIRMEVDHG